MILNGRKFKGTIVHASLFLTEKSEVLPFIEKQKETGNVDKVNVTLNLSGKQYALFANEYRPEFLSVTQSVDIFILIVDEERKVCASWLIDIKETIGGEHVIKHLIDQWNATYKHKNTLTAYLPDYEESETIGVVTLTFDEIRIRRVAADLKTKIELDEKALNKMPSAPFTIEQRMELLKKKKGYQMYNKFADRLVEINGRDYPITVYKMEGTESPYICNMEVSVTE